MTCPRNLRIGIASLLFASAFPAFAVSQTNTVDPTIYGARPLDARPEMSAGSSAVAGYKAPEAVPGVQALKGAESLMTEGAARIAADNVPEAGVLASVGAAMKQWSPLRLFKHLKAPAFTWTPGFNPASMLSRVEFPLDLAQEKFLLETRSPEEFQYNLEELREEKIGRKAIADNPLAALVAVLITYAVVLSVPFFGLRTIFKRKKMSTGSATALGNVK